MLIAFRALHHPRDMQPRLVSESADTHVGKIGVRADIGELAHIARYIGQLRQVPIADAIDAHLDLERRYDEAFVDVAAAFPVAVDGALDLNRASLHRSQAVRYRQLSIVMGVNTQR